MRTSILILVACLPTSMLAQRYISPDFATLAKTTEKINIQDLGFSNKELPSSSNLLAYCPPPIEQDGYSCTGFATCYAAMSIMNNVVENRTDFAEKLFTPFDPYFLYAGITDKSNLDCFSCECGARLTDGLDFLKAFGGKKYWVSPDLSCQSRVYTSDLSGFKNRISNYRIDEYYSVVDFIETTDEWVADPDIDMMKEMIVLKYPIIAGIQVEESFGLVDGSGYYSPMEQVGGGYDGHAVAIVGFDDNKNGGSFLVMNSYGSDWGDNGYFWMSYDNVEKHLIEGYVMYREDGFEGWKETISSPNYCRFIKDDLLYEGGMDDDNFLHGSCFEIKEGKWGGTGTYVHGYRHGTWLMCDYSTSENGFFGYVEFDQGEIVDNESFGFATTEMVTHNEADQLLGMLNLELDQNQSLKNPESLGQEKRSSAFVPDEGNDDDLGCIFGAKDKTNYQVLKTGYKAKILFSGGWGADFIIELEGSIYSENLSDVYFIKDGFCSWEDNVIVIDDEVFGVAQVEKL